MFQPASHDAAWLHSLFSVVALNHDLVIGNNKVSSPEALFHRGQALRLVQERLRDSPMGVCGATMASVAALANHEVLLSLVTWRNAC